MRDDRLDFWRGLCLVDMVSVHLAYEGLVFGDLLTPVITQWMRFAAGGFVFVAGASVARIFLPKTALPASRRVAYRDLRRRALYLLGIHYAAAASFLALSWWQGWRAPTADPMGLIGDVLWLREAPPYADVLPLYVAMLLVSPLLLEAMRRGHGVLVALVSVCVFAAGQATPWILSPRVGETFPLVLWQSIFVIGMLFGAHFSHYERRTPLARRAVLASVWTLAGVMAFAAHIAWDNPNLASVDLAFRKIPLGVGEWLRYLTLTVAVLLTATELWPRIAASRLAGMVATIGRRSLAVYVAHVWVQALILGAVAAFLEPTAWQGVLALAALAALYLLARGLDRWTGLVEGHATALRHLLRGPAAPPLGAAVLVLVVFLPLNAEITSAPSLVEVPTVALEPMASLDATEPAVGAPLDVDTEEPVLDLEQAPAPAAAEGAELQSG